MDKAHNLLLVTEHYPCGDQENFLELEISYLAEKYNVHVVCSDTDQLMTRSLPKGALFSRPAESPEGFRNFFMRLQCRFSRGYSEEKKEAKRTGKWTKEFKKNTLDALCESRVMYNYIKSLDFFEEDLPLTIYSANLNNSLYGLCCLKEYCEHGIKVVARCHNANMFDPVTDERRETLNYIVNHTIDEIYFTNEKRRLTYIQNFATPDCPQETFRVAPLGVPSQPRDAQVYAPEFFLRILTCCPMEEDKRLDLMVDALAMMETGCVEWVHIGGGSLKNAVMAKAQERLDNRAGIRYKFLGKLTQKELYEYYRDHYVDVFFSVSAAESVPTSMMEAMANHIFVCATDVDGVSDVVDAQNGILMPRDLRPEQLAAVLENLCQISKESIQQKGEAAYKSWYQRFDSSKNYRFFANQIAVPSVPEKRKKKKYKKQENPTPIPPQAPVPIQTPILPVEKTEGDSELK